MNQWKSVILVFALGAIVWLSIALVQTENQRNAAMSGVCIDPNFKNQDEKCLKYIETRKHWWQHLQYALTNI